jgi:CHAT domain-containing protein/Tfp pilus assembly protein PilF
MLATPMHGQALRASRVSSAGKVEPQLLPGVVVEKVEKNSEADKAGLREGDVLLSWSRGDQQGKLESPFDISWLDIEQRPRGSVTVCGQRLGRKQSWDLGAIPWYLNVRPNLSGYPFIYFQSFQKSKKLRNPSNRPQRLLPAVDLSVPSQPAWLSAWLLFRVADILGSTRERRASDDLYRRVEDQAAKCQPRVQSEILQMLAQSYWSKKNWLKAQEYYGKSLVVLRRSGVENLSVAWRLVRIAGAKAGQSEDFSSAKNDYLEALEIQQSLIPGKFDIGVTLSGLGVVETHSGNLSRAKTYLLQARAIQDPYGQDNQFVATTVSAQGTLAFFEGDLARADECQRRALAIENVHAPNSLRVANLLDGLGVTAWYRGDFAGAEHYFRQEIKIQRNAPESLNAANALTNLGAALREQGAFLEARKYHYRAIAIEKRLAPKGRALSRSYSNLATLDLQENKLVEADKYFEQALIIEKSLGAHGDNIQAILNDLASLSIKRGHMEKALAYLKEAETIAPESRFQVQMLAALANVSRRAKRFREAQDYYQRAISTVETQFTRLGGGDEARAAYRAQQAAIYSSYVDLLASQNDTAAAFHVLESSRARAFLEILSAAQVNIRFGVASDLLAQERSLYSEIRAKSDRRIQIMAEHHTDEKVLALGSEITALEMQYQDVEAQIRATSPGYAALTQPQPLTAKEVQTQLLDENTLLLEYSLGEERSYVFAVTPDSLQAFELPKRAVVEKASRRVYSLLTARNITMKNETEAQKQSRIARAEAQYPQAAAGLSKMLLGPVASQLQKRRLLIVTDGALAYIPFSVLPEPQSPAADVALTASASSASSSTPSSARSVVSSTTSPTATPLMVNHEIVNLPSASVLAVLRQQELGRKPAPKAVAVLADPVFDRHDSRLSSRLAAVSLQGNSQTRSARAPSLMADPLLDPPSSMGLLTRSAADVGLSRNGVLRLPRLLFSRREADEIMAVTPQGEGKEAVDFEASRATATSPELSQYRIIHFATHGLLDSVHPELSGLVFSMVDKNGRPQNGFLELQDIYNLNLPADLVVLSACETGLGKEISGEGLVGLTRGFMYAGASRVMASLWKVSDSGTAALMGNFYAAMEKDGLPPAAALRAAQIKMWRQKRWRDPYYWAAFQLQGEWK